MEKHREQRDRERETERYTETQPGRQARGRWAAGGRAGIEEVNKGRWTEKHVKGWVVLESKVSLRGQVCGGRSWAGSRLLGGWGE